MFASQATANPIDIGRFDDLPRQSVPGVVVMAGELSQNTEDFQPWSAPSDLQQVSQRVAPWDGENAFRLKCFSKSSSLPSQLQFP